MNAVKAWPWWAFVIAAGGLWGLPRFPHYHEDLPYIYDLGGLAFVVWFMGLGFLSLGMFTLVTNYSRYSVFRIERLSRFLIGAGALILAGALAWLYLLLLEMSLKIN